MNATPGASAARARTPASETGPADPLALVVFGLLALACFGALLLTQRLKHTATAVQEVRLSASFTPTVGPGGPHEAISFHLADTEPVSVAVVNGDLGVVATLIIDHPQRRYRRLYLSWNGHAGPCAAPTAITCASAETGPLVAAGSYRLRITLVRQRRTIYSPTSFRLLGSGGAGS